MAARSAAGARPCPTSREGARRVYPHCGLLRSLLRPGAELKFKDTVVNDAVVASTGTIEADSIHLIAQGTTESERIGRAIRIKKIQARFLVSIPSTSTPGETVDNVRIIVYKDKQANGAAATITGLLETAAYLSFNNLANSRRFQILLDKKVQVNCTSGAYDGTNDQFGSNSVYFEWYKSCDIPVEYDSTVGAITEIRSDNIGVAYISANGFAAVGAQFRVRYDD